MCDSLLIRLGFNNFYYNKKIGKTINFFQKKIVSLEQLQ